MDINKYFDIVEADFEIYGEIKNEWEPYINGKNYQAFELFMDSLQIDTLFNLALILKAINGKL